MVVSMTGFGRGTAENGGRRASVEVRTVNGRYADVSVHLPRTLVELEPRIKELVLAHISRGNVTVSVSIRGDAEEYGTPVLNESVLAGYQKGIDLLRERLNAELAGDPIQFAQLPHVFEFQAQVADLEAVWSVVAPACEEAAQQCRQMRATEGEKLVEDMAGRVRLLDDLVRRVEELAPGRVTSARQRLEEKLKEFLGPNDVDETRMLTEIALLADRVDITEECVRFHSHNGQFLKAMEATEAAGRRLNFLLQEMLREANTIGSKANDAEISHLVVEMKEEIEKLKEQVQNIE